MSKMTDNYLDQFKHCFTPQQFQQLQEKRKEIFETADNIFWSHLEKVELTLSEVTIISCDQGGWPFQALYMKLGTGHSTSQFYDMVLAVLRLMKS